MLTWTASQECGRGKEEEDAKKAHGGAVRENRVSAYHDLLETEVLHV